jgi:hypothetical protein
MTTTSRGRWRLVEKSKSSSNHEPLRSRGEIDTLVQRRILAPGFLQGPQV